VEAVTRTVLPRTGVSSWSSDADAWPGRTGWDTELANLNDKVAIWGQGTTAARPTAGYAGRYWWATDSLRLFYDDGTQWTEVSPVGGGGAPTVITAGDIAAEGSSRIGARADHAHALPAPAADPATVNYGGGTSRGSSGTLARADHGHALPALPYATVIPPLVDAVGAVGTSTSLARADHTHAAPLATTVPPAVATTGAVGTSTSVARADHTHAATTPPWGGAWNGTYTSSADGSALRPVVLTAQITAETLNSGSALVAGRVVIPYTGIYAGTAHANWGNNGVGGYWAMGALDIGGTSLPDSISTVHVMPLSSGTMGTVVPFSKRLTAGTAVTCSTSGGPAGAACFYIHLVALG